jgi:1-phosphofructokinase family hexose kinase
MKLILTLTINPALDHNVMVDRLAFEDRGYILSTSDSPGGRGINASRVIHKFGGDTVAIATAGGKTGERFQQLTGCCSFPMDVVATEQELRTNLTITDKQGLTVKLNEAGPRLTQRELDRVTQKVEERLEGATWFMICGSLPPGVPATYYKELIELARARNVNTLLDTDGDALLHGMEANPTVVSPNQPETERLLSRALITRSHILEALGRLHGMGPASVVLSLGSRGAVARDSSDTVEALPPRIDAVSPIGSGDALAAAFVWAMDQGKPFIDAVRWGVAAGTASAQLPGVTFAGLEATSEIYRQVDLRFVS